MAIFVDALILSNVTNLFLLAIGDQLPRVIIGAGGHPAFTGAWLNHILLINLVFWLYFTILESSPLQATPGKMIFGARATDLAGHRISFGKANARYWSKQLSSAILGIGYLMAGWTARKQALHDKIADTLVVLGPSSLTTGVRVLVVIIAFTVFSVVNAHIYGRRRFVTIAAHSDTASPPAGGTAPAVEPGIGASGAESHELDNATLMVRPGSAVLGNMKVATLLKCIVHGRDLAVTETDKGDGREVVHLDNADNKNGNWMELNFRLMGPVALLKSVKVSDGTSFDDPTTILIFLNLACSASARVPGAGPEMHHPAAVQERA